MMGGDCSFNLGPFLVTFITYRHAMIKDCKSSKSPVVIGTALLHIRRTQQSYSYLVRVLTTICPDLANIQWIGTDKEKAVFQGLRKSMPRAQNGLCTKHVRDNV